MTPEEMVSLPDEWDPAPHQRTWYSEASTGDRAYLVKRNGAVMVRLDRPMQDLVYPLDRRWKPDRDARPLNMAQLAMVAFAADRELCRVLGQPRNGKETWLSLNETERADWIRGLGIANETESAGIGLRRAGLHELIREFLQELAK